MSKSTHVQVVCMCIHVSVHVCKPSLLCHLPAAIVAGGVGACIGTPAEISLIRMTSDGR